MKGDKDICSPRFLDKICFLLLCYPKRFISCDCAHLIAFFQTDIFTLESNLFIMKKLCQKHNKNPSLFSPLCEWVSTISSCVFNLVFFCFAALTNSNATWSRIFLSILLEPVCEHSYLKSTNSQPILTLISTTFKKSLNQPPVGFTPPPLVALVALFDFFQRLMRVCFYTLWLILFSTNAYKCVYVYVCVCFIFPCFQPTYLVLYIAQLYFLNNKIFPTLCQQFGEDDFQFHCDKCSVCC